MNPEEILPPTDIITTAGRFINSTSAPIFLTGKAGTGKTTFLRSLASVTHKSFIVVAPTGIAALNAGGTTIHSQFLFPFGMFIPERDFSSFNPDGNLYSSDTLAKKHPLNSARKQVLRTIDLLVIDEVSMLRADLLDAIDYRMKAARGNFRQSFGGVQVLLIGDLYQLPPVVKREEETILRQYYKSPWFFESRALQQSGFVYIELDKIFRQKDSIFIDLLNNLRNNCTTREDIDELNKHYTDSETIRNMRDVITLTTHNFKADEMNRNALKALQAQQHTFHASVEGEFPESMFPVLQQLELKEGAQIMFIKNDTEQKAYFNGKLATVKSIKGDGVMVEMSDTQVEYKLKKVVWENKRYTIQSTTQDLEEEVIGTFEQYPVKLAWAITVHKSQGLTFDKAVIDVAEAFADGQVYVALSRLRSLDGLILRTRVNPNVISTDKQIVSFTSNNHRPDELAATIKNKQRDYILECIARTFDFDDVIKEIAYILRDRKDDASLKDESMQTVLQQISSALSKEKNNTLAFRRQLHTLFEGGDNTQLLERIQKGSTYYKNLLWEEIKLLLQHLEEMRHKKRVKTYLTRLTDLDQILFKKLEETGNVLHLAESILAENYDFAFSKLASERSTERLKIITDIKEKTSSTVSPAKKKKKSSTKTKKDGLTTHDITYSLFTSGMSVEDIAKERGLSVGTIESHIVLLIGLNKIEIYSFINEADVASILHLLSTQPDNATLSQLYKSAEEKFSYAQLRAVIAHRIIMETKKGL